MSKVHDAFGIHRPGAASAPRYLLLCALLLTIPAFYIELDVAAVIVPSFAKAGLSAGILSGRPLPGC